jgi:hypothetical protein
MDTSKDLSLDGVDFDHSVTITNKAGVVVSAKTIFCILWTYLDDVLVALKELLAKHPIWLWCVNQVIKAANKAYINLGCEVMPVADVEPLLLKSFNETESRGDIEAAVNGIAKDQFEDNHFEMLKEFILNCEVIDFVQLKRHIETESAKQPK